MWRVPGTVCALWTFPVRHASFLFLEPFPDTSGIGKKQTNNQKNPPKKLHVKKSPEIYDAEEIGVKDKYVFNIICIGFYLCVIIENHPVGRTNHR